MVFVDHFEVYMFFLLNTILKDKEDVEFIYNRMIYWLIVTKILRFVVISYSLKFIT